MIELADLRDLPVFEGVSDETLNRVVAHVADVRVDEGQWLVREGESAAFYVLLSGTFDLMKRYPDGMRRLAVREDPGDFLGELPIVFGTPFFAGARASDCAARRAHRPPAVRPARARVPGLQRPARRDHRRSASRASRRRRPARSGSRS